MGCSAVPAVVLGTQCFDYLGSMDLKTLKLELLERIALLEDEPRLLALKRLLDGPPTYTLPSEHLSVVREGEAPYLKLEDRMYTAEEVRALVEEVLRAAEADQEDNASHFTAEEWDAMDREREQADRGEGTFYSIDEVMEHMKKDLGK
jgi:hypothetical protein